MLLTWQEVTTTENDCQDEFGTDLSRLYGEIFDLPSPLVGEGEIGGEVYERALKKSNGESFFWSVKL
jgi:hypothetical protein